MSPFYLSAIFDTRTRKFSPTKRFQYFTNSFYSLQRLPECPVFTELFLGLENSGWMSNLRLYWTLCCKIFNNLTCIKLDRLFFFRRSNVKMAFDANPRNLAQDAIGSVNAVRSSFLLCNPSRTTEIFYSLPSKVPHVLRIRKSVH
jgi:hypothetical protein